MCFCRPGYDWTDGTHTACAQVGGARDNPVVKPENQKTGQCNVSVVNGADEPEQYTIDVYKTIGSVLFTYNTENIKDRIHIYHGSCL